MVDPPPKGIGKAYRHREGGECSGEVRVGWGPRKFGKDRHRSRNIGKDTR